MSFPAIANKLMPWLQAVAAIIIISIFATMALGPMFGLKPADVDMKETEKAVVFTLVGFLFGSAVSSSKKDDQNAALTAQLIGSPALALNPTQAPAFPADPGKT